MKPAGLLLYPGAGTSADHPFLVAVEDAVSVPVRRVDFGYRNEGRPFPPRADKLVPEVVREAESFAQDLGTSPDRIVLGGRSMGGRVCSMAVADGLPAAGLVLVCYPLHPPKKPDKLRVDHFDRIAVPCLFVSGTKDEFGSPAEFDEHLPAIAGPVTRVQIEGKRHDLRGADAEVIAAIDDWLASPAG